MVASSKLHSGVTERRRISSLLSLGSWTSVSLLCPTVFRFAAAISFYESVFVSSFYFPPSGSGLS